jgi:hypothetical protein
LLEAITEQKCINMGRRSIRGTFLTDDNADVYKMLVSGSVNNNQQSTKTESKEEPIPIVLKK